MKKTTYIIIGLIIASLLAYAITLTTLFVKADREVPPYEPVPLDGMQEAIGVEVIDEAYTCPVVHLASIGANEIEVMVLSDNISALSSPDSPLANTSAYVYTDTLIITGSNFKVTVE